MRKRGSPILPCPRQIVSMEIVLRPITPYLLPMLLLSYPLVKMSLVVKSMDQEREAVLKYHPRAIQRKHCYIPTVKGSVETQVDPGDRVVLLRAQLALRHPPRRRERWTHHAGKFRHASTSLI